MWRFSFDTVTKEESHTWMESASGRLSASLGWDCPCWTVGDVPGIVTWALISSCSAAKYKTLIVQVFRFWPSSEPENIKVNVSQSRWRRIPLALNSFALSLKRRLLRFYAVLKRFWCGYNYSARRDLNSHHLFIGYRVLLCAVTPAERPHLLHRCNPTPNCRLCQGRGFLPCPHWTLLARGHEFLMKIVRQFAGSVVIAG